MSNENNQTEEPQRNVTRRDFLKYSAGVAAVAVGAGTILGNLTLPSVEPTAPQNRTISDAPLVVHVNGDEVTVMSGDNEVKVKDAGLASAIASKMQ